MKSEHRVCPINIRAGCSVHHKKPAQAPMNEAAITASSRDAGFLYMTSCLSW